MRGWFAAVRLMWQARRASRRALLRYARYGPGYGADPDAIREAYARAGDALVRAAAGKR